MYLFPPRLSSTARTIETAIYRASTPCEFFRGDGRHMLFVAIVVLQGRPCYSLVSRLRREVAATGVVGIRLPTVVRGPGFVNWEFGILRALPLPTRTLAEMVWPARLF